MYGMWEDKDYPAFDTVRQLTCPFVVKATGNTRNGALMEVNSFVLRAVRKNMWEKLDRLGKF